MLNGTAIMNSPVFATFVVVSHGMTRLIKTTPVTASASTRAKREDYRW
jgi:hypothetical protein